MPTSEPSRSVLDAENALLRDQVAALTERVQWLESRCHTLLDERFQLCRLASTDGVMAALHPEDRLRTELAWRHAITTQQEFEIEHRLRQHDGDYRWFITRGAPVLAEDGDVQEWIGWTRDIEHEKRTIEAMSEQAARIEAESKALRKSEAMLAESQRMARIGSFELDLATLQLTWSEQQFRNFGLAPAPTINRTEAVARIHPSDRDRHEAVVKQAIERMEGFTLDYRVVHADGKVLDIHTIGMPGFDADGRLTKFIGTSQDVTERTRLEAQLRAQYAQLMALDQLKSNFVNSVTHELRTPLTSIMGYAEFLEDEIGGPVTPGQQEFVHQIQRGAMRLEYLLNDLLDFARMEAGTFTLKVAPAELGDRVREVIESLRPQADETKVSLVACLADDPLELEMDAQRIGQVLTNLLSNAIKFSPKWGTVRISIRQREGAIRCAIADAGPGISDEEKPRLFQRFSQLGAGVRMGKGAGLGLSISKALVEAHGGSIGVESTPGAGSTFWFELPVKQGQD